MTDSRVSDVKKHFGQTALNTPAKNVSFVGDLTAWINWAKTGFRQRRLKVLPRPRLQKLMSTVQFVSLWQQKKLIIVVNDEYNLESPKRNVYEP